LTDATSAGSYTTLAGLRNPVCPVLAVAGPLSSIRRAHHCRGRTAQTDARLSTAAHAVREALDFSSGRDRFDGATVTVSSATSGGYRPVGGGWRRLGT
jgi:hypothetical protein